MTPVDLNVAPAKHTPGATIAAEKIFGLWAESGRPGVPEWSIRSITAIIDQETAAPELLEGCEASVKELLGIDAYLTTCDPAVIIKNIDSLTHKMNAVREKVEAAIRKAKGEL